jgi:hypothetical protein
VANLEYTPDPRPSFCNYAANGSLEPKVPNAA